ncbi:MAG: type II secretion system secretin GspD, partial [Rhodobacterales bacterium]|nr:type II secretion system secretin GspD [Rhodobacterales bacterium]
MNIKGTHTLTSQICTKAAMFGVVFTLALALPGAALAQDEAPEPPTSTPTTPTRNLPVRPSTTRSLPTPAVPTTAATTPAQPGTITPSRQAPVELGPDAKIQLDFYDTNLYDLLTFMSDQFRYDFILADVKELQGKKVHIISHQKVPKAAAWEAFLSAMEVSGFTVIRTGNGIWKVVKSSEAGQTPIAVGTGRPSRSGDAFVTQLIQLDNVSVGDVSKVVTTLVPPEAKVVAYQPTNTLIITDTANNLRKVFDVLTELDVAAPKSTLKITPIRFAEAAEVKALLEELYGSAETAATSSTSRSTRASSRTSRTSRSRNTAAPAAAEGVTAGVESKYISKIIDDERTNSIIVLANEIGHKAVTDLLLEIDVDVDPSNRAQIHVVYLEHSKAEEVASVLSELSQDGSGGANKPRPPQSRNQPPAQARAAAATASDGEGKGAIAAFGSATRIAADENTNSLVIIANQEDYRVVQTVISQLDVERKQVFVDVVILELSSEDTFDLGLAAHLPTQPSADSTGIIGGQFGTQSLGLTQDLLSGLAVGVFGPSVDVPFADGTTLPVPAFGIVLNALKSNASVNIVSNPNIMTLDNEEAEIVVGRRIPFPTSAGMNNLGQPVISYQREDVAITLKVTPRVNSSNFVTLEVELEVQEIEEDDAGLDIQQSGPVTSKREEKTKVLVADNQTVVLGGLVGTTDTEVETKFPILGDLPLLGALFRGKRTTTR